MVERGYARAEGDGIYVLGPRLLSMAGDMLHELDAAAYVLPLLRELHDEVGHTVHFATLSDDRAVYLAKLVDPGLPYQFASRVGGRIPLHCTAIGKSLLAAMPPGQARDLLRRGALERRTPNTLVSPAAIGADLDRVRERGFAVDDEENERNIRCVGAVVRDHRGVPAYAISVSALTVELSPADALRLGPRVAAAAGAVSSALGARPNSEAGGRDDALDQHRLAPGSAKLAGGREQALRDLVLGVAGDLLEAMGDPRVGEALEHPLDVLVEVDVWHGGDGRQQLLGEQPADECLELRVGDRLGHRRVAPRQPEVSERRVARVEQAELHRLVRPGVGHELRARALPRRPRAGERVLDHPLARTARRTTVRRVAPGRGTMRSTTVGRERDVGAGVAQRRHRPPQQLAVARHVVARQDASAARAAVALGQPAPAPAARASRPGPARSRPR